jgi:hypothetical protein
MAAGAAPGGAHGVVEVTSFPGRVLAVATVLLKSPPRIAREDIRI